MFCVEVVVTPSHLLVWWFPFAPSLDLAQRKKALFGENSYFHVHYAMNTLNLSTGSCAPPSLHAIHSAGFAWTSSLAFGWFGWRISCRMSFTLRNEIDPFVMVFSLGVQWKSQWIQMKLACGFWLDGYRVGKQFRISSWNDSAGIACIGLLGASMSLR